MILKYLRKKDWVLLAIMAALAFIQVYLELEIPGYMSTITMIMTAGGTVDQVLAEGGWMMACAVGSLVVTIIESAIAAYVGTQLAKTLRDRQFRQVESYSTQEINKFSIYSLITRSTNDVTQVQMALTIGMVVLIKAPIMVVWALFKISTKNMVWTSATAVAIVVLILSLLAVMWYVVPKFKRIQWLTDDVNRVTKEGLSGIRVVHAYNAEDYQEDKFKAANANLTGTHLSVTRALAFLSPSMTLIISLLALAIYWLGAFIINAADGMQKFVEFSDMIVFSSYAMMILGAFIMLIIVFMILPRAMVAAKRIEEVISTDPSIKDGTVTESPEGRVGEISFKNVSFKYPGASDYVLKDVSLDVNKGEVVAFIGSTGSGKSTLISLVPRFYDVTEGSLEIDGVNVKDYTLEALYKKIGYVPQKAVMFKGDITSNVNYGDTEALRTEEDVKKAISIAQGTDFVEMADGQYHGSVAEGGVNLSGGQKQRLSIARAVCRKPEIYIFDDSFSALDYKTDRILRSALKKETEGVTTLIVAQRIGTIMDADKIVVLNEGVVVGIGKHSDLLKDCEVYREIAASQLTEEEMMQ